jgi:hypothetical protein
MNGIYKFLNKEHVDDFTSGKFLFGRSGYYRMLEVSCGDRSKGDKNECRGEMFLNTKILPSDPDREMKLERLKKAGTMNVIGAGLGPTIIFENSLSITENDVFILSLSFGEKKDLEKIFKSEFNYDGCVKILNPKKLLNLIWREGVETLSGKKINEIFTRCEYGKVSYKRRVTDIEKEDPDLGDPFLKDAIYSNQSEVRMVLHLRESINLNHILVQVAKNKKMPREILLKC